MGTRCICFHTFTDRLRLSSSQFLIWESSDKQGDWLVVEPNWGLGAFVHWFVRFYPILSGFVCFLYFAVHLCKNFPQFYHFSRPSSDLPKTLTNFGHWIFFIFSRKKSLKSYFDLLFRHVNWLKLRLFWVRCKLRDFLKFPFKENLCIADFFKYVLIFVRKALNNRRHEVTRQGVQQL